MAWRRALSSTCGEKLMVTVEPGWKSVLGFNPKAINEIKPGTITIAEIRKNQYLLLMILIIFPSVESYTFHHAIIHELGQECPGNGDRTE